MRKPLDDLKTAYVQYLAGEITQPEYAQIERRVVREMKAFNAARYGRAMKRKRQ